MRTIWIEKNQQRQDGDSGRERKPRKCDEHEVLRLIPDMLRVRIVRHLAEYGSAQQARGSHIADQLHQREGNFQVQSRQMHVQIHLRPFPLQSTTMTQTAERRI